MIYFVFKQILWVIVQRMGLGEARVGKSSQGLLQLAGTSSCAGSQEQPQELVSSGKMLAYFKGRLRKIALIRVTEEKPKMNPKYFTSVTGKILWSRFLR